MKNHSLALSTIIALAIHSWLPPALAQVTNSPAQSPEVIGTIERLDPRFDALVPKDAKLEKIAEGFIWTEGITWSKAGKFAVFSDIPNNVTHKWKEGEGITQFLAWKSMRKEICSRPAQEESV